jgi:hypothetical protein
MRNINAIAFPELQDWNKIKFEIFSVNGNNCVDFYTIFSNFSLLFADGFFIESEDEEELY